MATLGLGPVIGKLGGVEVQKIPVDIVASGVAGSVVVMHTVHVPEGETWIVALIGNLSPRYTNNNGPKLSIGEMSIGPGLPKGRAGLAAEVTGTAEIALKRGISSNGIDTFVGHVYTVPLPD